MKKDVLISTITTMRLGGKARYVREITEVGQIRESYEFAKKNDLSVYVLGEGSNVVGRDDGYDGLILVNKLKGIEAVSESGGELLVKAYGGEVWDNVVKFTTDRGYSGIEAMSAIPGTMGAAPVQNVGAYGQEIKDVLLSADVYDSRDDDFKTIAADEMKMSYRKSIFNTVDKGRYFIISGTMKLKKGELKPPFYISLQNYVEKNGITDFSPGSVRKMVAEIRANKLPDPRVEASSGSFFKNVIVSDEEAERQKAKGVQVWRENEQNVIPSGWLIEAAGLKGKTFHGMRVSEKAALILINDSAKTYADLAKARKIVIDTVKDKFGFVLEQEPSEIE